MARRDIAMTPAEVQEFLAAARTIDVATLGPRGWPHVAPMWYTLRDGNVAFRSFTKSQKIVNLKRDPKVTLLAEEGSTYGELRGVMIEGQAELIEDPGLVLEIYGGLSARYVFSGDEPVVMEGDALEAAFGRFADNNTAVIVHANRVTSWDHTKLAGAY